MSVTYWIIASRPCEATVHETLRDAERLMTALVALPARPNLTSTAQFCNISESRKIRDVIEDTWTWPSTSYMWVTLTGVPGGLDIEIEQVDENQLDFLSRDMRSRLPVEISRQNRAIEQATNGTLYSIRLSGF